MKNRAIFVGLVVLGGVTAINCFAQDESYQNQPNPNYEGGAGSYQQAAPNSGFQPTSGGFQGGGFSHFPSARLNNMLNQVEQSGGGWQGPSGMPNQGLQTGQQGGFSAGGSPMGYQSSPAMSPMGQAGGIYPQQGGMGGMYPQSSGMMGGMRPQGMMPQNTGMAMMPQQAGGGGLLNGFAPFGGMKQPLQSGPSPFSPKGLLRIFLEGGSGGMGGGSGGSGGNSSETAAKNASVTGQAEALLNRARNQAAQAVSDSERAHKGYGDKGSRLAAASSAQYHANDARAAADQAASITYSGPQYAKDYAAQARNEANRAQEAADRAQYNANVE